jgi:hypothetical protein
MKEFDLLLNHSFPAMKLNHQTHFDTRKLSFDGINEGREYEGREYEGRDRSRSKVMILCYRHCYCLNIIYNEWTNDYFHSFLIAYVKWSRDFSLRHLRLPIDPLDCCARARIFY